jgi:succinate dehydrogenase / fumarate reductase membrane anchor subunit
MGVNLSIGKIAKCRLGQEGVFHWLMQRVTAIALLPLPLWMAFYLRNLLHSSYEQFSAWLLSPWNVFFLTISILAASYHAVLGVRTVLDDYVQWERGKVTTMAIVNTVFILLVIAVWAALWGIG